MVVDEQPERGRGEAEMVPFHGLVMPREWQDAGGVAGVVGPVTVVVAAAQGLAVDRDRLPPRRPG